jgi:hypothetical protein
MTALPEGQQCDNCRCFSKEEQYQGGVHYPGHCVRFPPIFHPSINLCLYPPVRGNAWCGEYAPANPETVSDGASTMARLVLLGDLTAARALADKLKDGDS